MSRQENLHYEKMKRKLLSQIVQKTKQPKYGEKEKAKLIKILKNKYHIIYK